MSFGILMSYVGSFEALSRWYVESSCEKETIIPYFQVSRCQTFLRDLGTKVFTNGKMAYNGAVGPNAGRGSLCKRYIEGQRHHRNADHASEVH